MGRRKAGRGAIELDHVVLEVRDPAASAAFYEGLLGCAPVRLREFEAGEAPFVSARLGPGSVLDFFPPRMWRKRRPANPNHFCLTLTPQAFRVPRAGAWPGAAWRSRARPRATSGPGATRARSTSTTPTGSAWSCAATRRGDPKAGVSLGDRWRGTIDAN